MGYLFLPRLQQGLDEFVDAWSHHAVRTERNKNPLRLIDEARDKIPTAVFFDDEHESVAEEALRTSMLAMWLSLFQGNLAR